MPIQLEKPHLVIQELELTAQKIFYPQKEKEKFNHHTSKVIARSNATVPLQLFQHESHVKKYKYLC